MLTRGCKDKLEMTASHLSQIYLENQESIPEDNKEVSFIGSGWFGKAYTLTKFPSFVIKFCAKEIDAFPVYIRYLEKIRCRPKWAPEVFLYGGNELDGVFWCIMPKYETIRSGMRYGEKTEVLDRFKRGWMDFQKKLLTIKAGRVDSSDKEAKEMESIFMHLCKLSGTLDDKGNPYLDIHAGNVLWNDNTSSFVYLDPLRYISVDAKKGIDYDSIKCH